MLAKLAEELDKMHFWSNISTCSNFTTHLRTVNMGTFMLKSSLRTEATFNIT
jgi:hypothetical protein